MLFVVDFPVAANRPEIKAELFELFGQAGDQRVLGLVAELVTQVSDYPLGLLESGLGLRVGFLGLLDGGLRFRMGLFKGGLGLFKGGLGLLDGCLRLRVGLLGLFVRLTNLVYGRPYVV
ncbi:MAG: hypothetical protein LBR93_01435 [Treponema sp.]|nr:hypothetical protein [Treponema sp.]